MGRCRFVSPTYLRIPLETVHQAALDALKARRPKASAEELAEAEAALAYAQADGAWIEIKRELNAGEQKRIFANMVRDGEMIPGERTKLDPEKVGITKILEYLVRWSLVDAQGEDVPVSADAINNLDTDTYREILAAVEAHEEIVDAERAARKNGQLGGKASPATSASRSGRAGRSSMSAH